MPIINKELLLKILLVSALILLGAFALFEWELKIGSSLAQARTVAANAVVIVLIFYLFSMRSLSNSIFRINLFSNIWVTLSSVFMILLQLIFTYVPFMNKIFGSSPLSTLAWLKIFLTGLLALLVVEIEKALNKKLKNVKR